MTAEAWTPPQVLRDVPKSWVLDRWRPGLPLGRGTRVLTVKCACGHPVASVTEAPTVTDRTMTGRTLWWLNTWRPGLSWRPTTKGEPFWCVYAGPLPGADESFEVRCPRHGEGLVGGLQVRRKLDSYRSTGRRRSVVVRCDRPSSDNASTR